MIPFVLLSDLHCHSWSQFATTNAGGVNSRLQIILDEMLRAADHGLSQGINRMVIAGDLFHVRGKIEPSVFNPTFGAFEKIVSKGMSIDIIPGNHDLEGISSDEIGNAMQQLSRLPGIRVITDTYDDAGTVIVPWIENLDELRAECIKHAQSDRDLIIHAPLNGVIKGIPDHGLEAAECAAWGYRRVFAGHYHDHNEFENGLVYSIGATTHQTWSDPDTLAGFMIVRETSVEHVETQAPLFVNIDDVAEITEPMVQGNYVRLRLKDIEEAELKAAGAQLDACGALGWVNHTSKKRDATRPVSAGPTNMTLEVSVANYVLNHHQSGALSKKRIAVAALAVLTEARTVGKE